MTWNRETLLVTSGAYWASCALHAAVRLDLFTLVGDRSPTVREVAGTLGAKGRGTAMLLNAMAAMGLLEKTGEQYANTAVSRSLLCTDSDGYVGHMILHHHYLVEGWARLHESVLTGEPARKKKVFERGGEQLEAFLMGMYTIASGIAPLVAGAVDLGGRRRLLDLGGGPGTYALHFCKENPSLEAVVFDLPTTRSFAEKTFARFGLTDRVSFLPGDYLEDDIPGRYDTAWLSHVLHGEGPEGCRTMLKKVAGALEPGGLLLVHEFILDDTFDGPERPALFSLNMLLGTESGRAYSQGQLTEMLKEAGAGDIRRLPFESPGQTGILAATV